MARSSATDFFHNQKFLVALTDSKDAANVRIQGGFTTCTMPELSLDTVLYKEGQMEYTRKFPGNPTFNDVSLARGVAKTNTDFDKWAKAAVSGKEYRADVLIYVVHRDQYLAKDNSDTSNSVSTTGQAAISGYKAGYRILLKNAFAIRCKYGSDLDSQGNEVSLEELDISYEYAQIEKGEFDIKQ